MSTDFSLTANGRTWSGRTNIADGFDLDSAAPLVIALHGGTYTSEYFDIAGYSLLDRAVEVGVPVIALDRPNYGRSAPLETNGSIIVANAEAIDDVIATIWDKYGDAASGVVLVAHSIGGAVATAVAASQPDWPLLGLATSGCLVRVPEESRAAWEALPPVPIIDLPVAMKDQVMFGPEGTYSSDMPAASYPANSTVPKAELLDITGEWIDRRAAACGAVSVPVHHRQAEYDALWITDDAEIETYRSGFTAAPEADIALQAGSGHCIDFHGPSAEFHRAQLEFALNCGTSAGR